MPLSRVIPVLLLLACSSPEASNDPTPGIALARPLGGTDHHVHLLGPDLIRDWKALGIPFSRPDSVYLRADRYLAEVNQIVLVSMAHAYGNMEMLDALELGAADVQSRVARENDHLLAEAARLAPRAVAFCSAPILAGYAMVELERCVAAGGHGIKLHLAASGVDLREPTDVAVVEAILGWAEERALPVLLHLDTQQRGTEVGDVDHFLRTAVEPHPDLVIVIAHLGGSGGYGDWTRSVFQTVNTWLAERFAADDPRPGVYFDLSAVVLEEESEGVPATTPSEINLLRADLAAIDIRRLLFGSDAPVFGPGSYATLLVDRAILSRDALENVLENSPIRN